MRSVWQPMLVLTLRMSAAMTPVLSFPATMFISESPMRATIFGIGSTCAVEYAWFGRIVFDMTENCGECRPPVLEYLRVQLHERLSQS